MIAPHDLIPFILASLTINLIPGPDMLFVLARTLSDHKRGGMLSTVGISTGLLLHTLAAASGLSLIILHSAIAFKAIKILGASYLIYLGIKFLLSKTVHQNIANEQNCVRSNGLIFKQGLITNLFNPKVIVFFLAFLPQFVVPTQGHIMYQFIELGLLFVVTGTCVNILVVLFSHQLKTTFGGKQSLKNLPERIAGVILITLGIKLILE